MLGKSVRLFTLFVVVNPFLIVSFQNCSRPSSKWLASQEKLAVESDITNQFYKAN